MKNYLYSIALTFITFFIAFDCYSREVENDTIFKNKSYQELTSLYSKAFSSVDTVQMYTIAKLILEKGKQENKPAYYVKGYQLLSATDRILSKYTESLKHIDKAISYLKEALEYEKKEQIYLSKGLLHQYLGEYKLALESYLEGLKFIKEENNTIKVSFYNNIATLKSSLYNSQGALEGYLEALKLIENEKNETYKNTHKLISLAGIAKAHIDLGNYKEGFDYCLKIIENNKTSNNTSLVQAYIGLGRIYSLTEPYEKALYYLEKAQKIENTIDKDYLDAVIYLFKARTFFFLEEYEEAISQLKMIEVLVDKNKFNHFHLEEMNILFAKSYHKSGNIEKANDYYERGLKIIKENSERKSNLSNNLLEKYDLGTLENDIAEVKSKIKSQKNRIKTFQITLILALICSSGFYFYIQRENKKKFSSLMSSISLDEPKKETQFKKNKRAIKIDDKRVKELLKKLQLFEDNEEYLDKNLDLLTVSRKLNTNTAYLSKVVNTYKKKSFSEYLIDLKMAAVIKKLKEEKRFRAYKMEYIAAEVGFNSISTFNRVFKQKTGIYPSYFIKQLEKES
ncbi:tetratricopeptide repeat protein [Flavobacteriaceae bacterium R38]|nr:tetratricopeptide repeat protein [Flavobacteriaceae bacterium R38]